MQKPELKETLRELGLTGNEAEVYLALLQRQPLSANTLAQKSGLHRQAVYDALDRLAEKGFVHFVNQNGTRNFSAMKPGHILEFLQEKEGRLRAALPALNALAAPADEETEVEVWKGSRIIRSLYRDIAEEVRRAGGPVLLSGAVERMFEEEDLIALQQHLRKLRELRCAERVLLENGDTHFVEGPQTHYRWVEKESFNPTPIFIYGDKTAMIVWGKPRYAIIIKSRAVAETQRRQFNALWKNAKEAKRITRSVTVE